MNPVDRLERDDGQTDRESSHRAERVERALAFDSWKQSMRKLKGKWTTFTRSIIGVIAEEEMKIRREEFDRQFETRRRSGK